MPAGPSQSEAAGVALEQEHAKVFLQRLYGRAHAGLRHAERIGGVAEIEMSGDGERPNERRKGMRRPRS